MSLGWYRRPRRGVFDRERESFLLIDGEGRLVADEARKSESGTLTALSLDTPLLPVAHDFHLASFTPPAIDFPGERDPKEAVGSQLREVIQQRQVRVSCSL